MMSIFCAISSTSKCCQSCSSTSYYMVQYILMYHNCQRCCARNSIHNIAEQVLDALKNIQFIAQTSCGSAACISYSQKIPISCLLIKEMFQRHRPVKAAATVLMKCRNGYIYQQCVGRVRSQCLLPLLILSSLIHHMYHSPFF